MCKRKIKLQLARGLNFLIYARVDNPQKSEESTNQTFVKAPELCLVTKANPAALIRITIPLALKSFDVAAVKLIRLLSGLV